jgi:uncharacterized protein (DUF1800 family)
MANGPNRIAHLLRRASFPPSWDELKTALTYTESDLVDVLLSAVPDPAHPGSWIDEIYAKPVTMPEQAAYDANNAQLVESLRAWWLSQMITLRSNIREKLTLFLSGHFTSEAKEVKVPQYLYRQNVLFRQNGLGDFRALVKRVNHDPAMLRYLGGDINVGGNPNENYARELMELFTMGEGHYTEQDIK